ncbi:MAG: hypothetical protein M0003_18670 [Acidithiobacillus sp.]|uniref:hypothetical protein n=1 Tax=Acidithiobacillus ferrooxidans TaxID=920 RepID=UPI000B2A701C|nr:hypothetical protein [Acidithiobacillus ferrooxidans]MDA8154706.1 hypothetical protein [Acidithiobacillus sp.]
MLQKVTDPTGNIQKGPFKKGGSGSYFNKEALAGEIIALLSVRPSLRAGEIDRRCPNSPEQQAVSDTLRQMRKQGLVQMSPQKTWRLCEGVQYSAEHMESVLMFDEKAATPVDIGVLKEKLLDALREAFYQPRKKHLTHTELVARFVANGEGTKHAISQALEQLVKEGLLIKPGDRVHDYMYNYAYFAKHPSLFDSLPDTDDPSSHSPEPVDVESRHDDFTTAKTNSGNDQLESSTGYDGARLDKIWFSDLAASDHDPDDSDESESDRRRRKMRIRRRVLVAQTRIQVQVRRRHKVSEE